MHPLRVVAVLPERAGAAVRTVGKTTVDAARWVGAGVTQWGCLPQWFCLGLHFTACTKDSVMFRLVRSGTDCAQLGLEGAYQGTVAVSPTPRADGDPNPLFSRLDGESDVAEHEAAALEASEVMTTSRVVNVSPLVNGVLPLGSKENLLDLKWGDGNGFAFGVISEFGTKVRKVGDAEEGFGQANLHLGLSGIVFTNPLRCGVEVCVHDLDVSLETSHMRARPPRWFRVSVTARMALP
jgi:hypothetical protein